MAKHFWALVGIGPNYLKIPALIFATQSAGLEHCTGILGEPTGNWDISRSYAVFIRDVPDGAYYWQVPAEEKAAYAFLVGDEQGARRRVFTDYYGGCGSCWRLVLVPVEEGKPFVGFNLD